MASKIRDFVLYTLNGRTSFPLSAFRLCCVIGGPAVPVSGERDWFDSMLGTAALYSMNNSDVSWH